METKIETTIWGLGSRGTTPYDEESNGKEHGK